MLWIEFNGKEAGRSLLYACVINKLNTKLNIAKRLFRAKLEPMT